MVATARTKIFNFIRIIHLNCLAKIELSGPPRRHYCSVMLYKKKKKKKLKETESEERKGFLSHFYHWLHNSGGIPFVSKAHGFKTGF